MTNNNCNVITEIISVISSDYDLIFLSNFASIDNFVPIVKALYKINDIYDTNDLPPRLQLLLEMINAPYESEETLLAEIEKEFKKELVAAKI